MKAQKIISCLFTLLLCASTCLISCSNASGRKNREKEALAADAVDEDFRTFIAKFTAGAKFQCSRIKFPLKTPITLHTGDGKEEKTFPFTEEKWPLLDVDDLKTERVEHEEGGMYVSRFVIDDAKHKVFEAGYEDSETDLRVEFELIDGKWYVIDCYTGWYGFDLTSEELSETMLEVQAENKEFRAEYP